MLTIEAATGVVGTVFKKFNFDGLEVVDGEVIEGGSKSLEKTTKRFDLLGDLMIKGAEIPFKGIISHQKEKGKIEFGVGYKNEETESK